MATQPIDPIEEHIAQAMADPKFVASLETVSDEELGRHLEDARRRARAWNDTTAVAGWRTERHDSPLVRTPLGLL